MIIKLRKDAVKKTAVSWNPCHEIIQIPVISHITAAAASPGKFFAQLLIFFN